MPLPAIVGSSSGSIWVAVLIIAAVVLLEAGVTIAARRRGYSGIGGNTVVRCRQGHLFTTIWIPLGSLKSVRLGKSRFQYCPVGKHWTLVAPVKDSDLTEDEKRIASEHKDVRIP